MPGQSRSDELVGREAPLDQVVTGLRRALDGERSTVLVSGPAGIGKTALIRTAVIRALRDSGATGATATAAATVAWGGCAAGGSAPGYWPWTQALNSLVRSRGADRARHLAGEDAPLLATIVPALGPAVLADASERTRLLLMDATTRWLEALGGERGVVVVLDDLHWADESSLALLDFVARAPEPAAVAVIGAYRDDELTRSTQQRLATLSGSAEHIHLGGLDPVSTRLLAERVARVPLDPGVADAIYRRTGGHPFFTRELAAAAQPGGEGEHVPAAIREAIDRRIGRLGPSTQQVLRAAAVAGNEMFPDVIAAATGLSPLDVETAAAEGTHAGVLVAGDDGRGRRRFAHDLFRETIAAGISTPERVALHLAIGEALEGRIARRAETAPSELARHFAAAVALDGTDRAARWALAAAAADHAALAFTEAAAHLRRLRAVAADAGAVIDDERLVDVLVAEADALARCGSSLDARGLLLVARDVAGHCADPARISRVALTTVQLGSRFAARRDEIVRELEEALAAVAGADPGLEAQLAAALARELAHSVTEDRPRAKPLSERALTLGRQAGDPVTLVSCLLAHHDVLWTPGEERLRAEIAQEIVAVAQRAGDDERQAEGLLLLANAQLEGGWSVFEATLEQCLRILDGLGQPRHRYTAETRRACVALLRGRLDEAAERIERAAGLGERIREPDVGNVRMSQRLELVRARNNSDELRDFAAEAVAHWIGAPIHAHAVAAGFSARAGDLDEARRLVRAVVDLGTWRADRSYLWSVFVRELSEAAVTLGDTPLCAELLGDVLPLAGSCGVNGAVVAFAGSHAETAGRLATALGRRDEGASLRRQAVDAYQRLGATGWLQGAMRTGGAVPAVTASLRRQGALWLISFDGRQATVPHTKGLADIARLVSRPGADVHVLELAGSPDVSTPGGDVVDRPTLESFRRRLADLDDDADEAARHSDHERAARLAGEREAILEELGRVTGVGGRSRQFSNNPAERARKAVSGRIRDTIRKLRPMLPELAAHLDQTIITGLFCRYPASADVTWKVDQE